MLEGEEAADLGAADGAIALGDGRAAGRTGGSAGPVSDASGGRAASGSRASAAADEADEWEIEYSELVLGQRIGIGSYGEVFKANWRQTDVAVKRFLEQDLSPQVMAVRFSYLLPSVFPLNAKFSARALGKMLHFCVLRISTFAFWKPALTIAIVL